MLSTMLAAAALAHPRSTYVEWGREALACINRDFFLEDSGLYGEERTPDHLPENVAFNWGVGVMLSALNAGARVDPKVKTELKRYADAIQVYWNPALPVSGFDVLPGSDSADRYYDDNAWMVMALAETSKILEDKTYLLRAQDALKFVLSGADNVLGGGVYWRESDKASKNTCANGPTVAAMMAVYEQSKDASLLPKAEAIYDWTLRTLQDPEDGLMWDAIVVADKQIGKTKWSYNTALMIRSAKALYAVTKREKYLQDARRMERASLTLWLPNGGKAGIKCEGKFAHLLAESYAFQPKFDDGVRARNVALDYLHQTGRDSKGRYGDRWDEKAPELWGKFMMIDQASAARAFFEAAH